MPLPALSGLGHLRQVVQARRSPAFRDQASWSQTSWLAVAEHALRRVGVAATWVECGIPVRIMGDHDDQVEDVLLFGLLRVPGPDGPVLSDIDGNEGLAQAAHAQCRLTAVCPTGEAFVRADPYQPEPRVASWLQGKPVQAMVGKLVELLATSSAQSLDAATPPSPAHPRSRL